MKNRTRKLVLFGVVTIAATAALFWSLSASPPAAEARCPGCNMGGGGGGGGGGTGGAGGDALPGEPFREPPELANLSTTPGEFQAVLEVAVRDIQVAGRAARMHTYNGSFPGPTIRVRRGDVLRLRLVNSLPATAERNLLGFEKNHTNLHTHGLHVSPEPPADAAHLDIAPGHSFDYAYDLRWMYPGSVSFYHPHHHGLVAEQYWAGMIGAIVVADEVDALAGFDERLMILKDVTLANGAPTPYASMMEFMHGKEGDLVMVNGQVNPLLATAPGRVQRWRIVNGSNARFYKLSLEGLELHLVGVDAGLLDRPYPLSSILLAPGERVDVLVTAPRPGRHRLLSLPYARRGNMASPQITLLTLDVAGPPEADVLPSVVDPTAARATPDLSMAPRRTLTLSMRMGRGFINGQDFDVQPYTIMSDVGTYEVWDIVNASGMDHPFHQHVDAAQVLEISGGDAGYAALMTTLPAWKDVVVVPRWGRVTLLVPVMHWPGMAMFHCHIVEHEDIGMMGMWHRMEGMPMP